MKIKTVFPLGSQIFWLNECNNLTRSRKSNGPGRADLHLAWINIPKEKCSQLHLPYLLSSFRCWLTEEGLYLGWKCGASWDRPKQAFHKILFKPSKTRCNFPFERDSISLLLKFLTKPCTLKVLKSVLMNWIEIPLRNWGGKTWSMWLLEK